MFIYYEHLSGNGVSFTDLALSSNGRDNKINWKDLKEQAYAELIHAMLKAIPPSEREFDIQTKIWTYVGDAGKRVISVLTQATQSGLIRVSIAPLKDLRGLQAKGDFLWTPYVPPWFNLPEEKKFDEKDFFYTPPVSSSSGIPTGDALYQRLADLMETPLNNFKSGDLSTQKKLYRAACIRLHPDRGGDASKMSELTMLWTAFNAS